MAPTVTVKEPDVGEVMNSSELPSKRTPVMEPAFDPYGAGGAQNVDLKAAMKRGIYDDLADFSLAPAAIPTTAPTRRTPEAKVVERALSQPKVADMQPCTLRVEIQKAIGLQNMDMMGLSDPFISFVWRGEEKKTASIKDNLNPKWNESFDLPYDPAKDPSTLRLKMFDEDLATTHDPMGDIEINLKESTYEKQNIKKPLSAVKGSQGTLYCTYQRMPEGAAPALKSKPAAETQEVPRKVEDLAPCFLRIEIQKATGLANMDMMGLSDPFVGFVWRGEDKTTSVIQDSLNPKWNETFDFPYDPTKDPETLTLKMFDLDLATSNDPMGDVEVNLKQTTYDKQSMKAQLTGKNGQGLLYFTTQRRKEAPPVKEVVTRDLPASVKAPPPQADNEPCMLKIEIQKGTGLANMDMMGASDPYVTFTWRGKVMSTAVIKDNLNPKWNETFEIPYDPAQDPPTLMLKMFDEDLATKHDPMGEVELDLKKSSYTKSNLKLKLVGVGGQGDLYCSYQRKANDAPPSVTSEPPSNASPTKRTKKISEKKSDDKKTEDKKSAEEEKKVSKPKTSGKTSVK